MLLSNFNFNLRKFDNFTFYISLYSQPKAKIIFFLTFVPILHAFSTLFSFTVN